MEHTGTECTESLTRVQSIIKAGISAYQQGLAYRRRGLRTRLSLLDGNDLRNLLPVLRLVNKSSGNLILFPTATGRISTCARIAVGACGGLLLSRISHVTITIVSEYGHGRRHACRAHQKYRSLSQERSPARCVTHNEGVLRFFAHGSNLSSAR